MQENRHVPLLHSELVSALWRRTRKEVSWIFCTILMDNVKVIFLQSQHPPFNSRWRYGHRLHVYQLNWFEYIQMESSIRRDVNALCPRHLQALPQFESIVVLSVITTCSHMQSFVIYLDLCFH